MGVNLCPTLHQVKLNAFGGIGLVNKTYAVDEIFEDIEGDSENVLMNIPPEIAEQMGWNPGDTLKITTEDGAISITKVDNGKR